MKAGDIEGAVEQTRFLVEELRTNDWDPMKVDHDLFRLPDQMYAENPRQRGRWAYAFYHTKQEPYLDDVVVFTDIYARKNLRVAKGKEATMSPEGYFIVGWRDGRVTTVPASEVRLYPFGEAELFVFPGMSEYRADLRPWGQAG